MVNYCSFMVWRLKKLQQRRNIVFHLDIHTLIWTKVTKGWGVSEKRWTFRRNSRLQITDSRSPVMMTGQIFFSPNKPRFWPVKLMNIIIIFSPWNIELRWQLIVVRHCRSGFCRQVGEKFIYTLLSSFPRFSPVLCPFIYTFSIIVRRCRKSPRFIL